jgi:microcystin-dependent protein
MSYFSGIDQRMRQQTFFNNSSTITQPLTQTNTELIANLQYVKNYVGNIITGFLPINNPIFTGTLSTISGILSVPTANITTSNITTGNITTGNITTANITNQGATQFTSNPTININSLSYPIQFRIIGEIKMLMPTTASYSPPNYLLCDGASYSVFGFSALFSAIGYSYGGSGANFNVPSFASRFPIGGNGSISGVSSSNYATGNGEGGYTNTQKISYNYGGGSTNITPLLQEVPQHSHNTPFSNSVDSTITPVGVQQYLYSASGYSDVNTLETGSNIQQTDSISGGDGVNITPSYIACNFWICYA